MRDAQSITTEKLYDRFPYESDFEAEVLEVSGRDVILDRTLFFPEEGGQSSDTGFLAGYKVERVTIREGRIIHHLAPEDAADGEKPLLPGDRIRGRIDFARRFSNMQNHTGEHILSGIICAATGFDNVGFHLSDREVTVDFSGELTPAMLREFELAANRAVAANLKTEVQVLPPEARDSIAYRSKMDFPGEVRVVIIPGIDACACCAPHVARTGEIGIIKILGASRLRGGTRLRILCGERALMQLAEEHDLLTETALTLTTSADRVPAQVAKLKEELKKAGERIASLGRELAAYRVREISPDIPHALLFLPQRDSGTSSLLKQMLEGRRGYAAIFTGSDGEGYAFEAASETLDVSDLLAAMKEKWQAKGGGRDGLIRGSVSAGEAELRRLFDEEFPLAN